MTARAIYGTAFSQGLRPESKLTVSEWADQYRLLSQRASAEAGRWRTVWTPYLREIMDALFSSSPYERVVFMKGAQIGGMGLNVVLVGLFALRLLEHLNRQAERFESRGRIGCKQYRPDLREGAESRSHCI